VITDAPATYRVCIIGHLDDRWSSWFGEFEIVAADDGTSTLTGPVADQAQLHGVLARLRDMGATLLSVRAIRAPEDGSATCQQAQVAAPADGGTATADVQLRVDALGVGAQGVERDEQVAGDLGSVEVGGQQL
jgi:hypothetical protein